LEFGLDAGAVVGVGLRTHRLDNGAEEAARRRREYDLEDVGVGRVEAGVVMICGDPLHRRGIVEPVAQQRAVQSSDPTDLLAVLAALGSLGAEPLARRVRLRLRELGVARIPRGPAQATGGNPAGLTPRQVDVVRLLAEGLSNAEIAAQLVLSVRTVDTHVAAILNKLDARTRRAAAAAAKALGLLGGR
jgi:DNA-binding NarL/FixJ family response regulator